MKVQEPKCIPTIHEYANRHIELRQNAHEFLEEASSILEKRAQLRDQPEGERSMSAIVKTFNALTGQSLTESEGWEFMIVLKMVRARQGKYNRDDYVDMAAYAALNGEFNSSVRKSAD